MSDQTKRQSDLSIVLPNGEVVEFNLIPAGDFLMGARGYSNGEPVHRVKITRPFYLGIYPVTQAQFAVGAESLHIDHTNHFDGNPKHPAENMDWHQARQWCEWLNTFTESIPSGYSARLPIEAEWEYACASWCETDSGRVYTKYYTGDGTAALTDAGWYGALFGGGNNLKHSTRGVGLLAPNNVGLFDMHGNVYEWCLDVLRADAYRYRTDGVCDPFCDGQSHSADPFDLGEVDEDAGRVFRGGSWGDSASYCRAAYRFGRPPGFRYRGLGFRVGLFPVHSCQTNQPPK